MTPGLLLVVASLLTGAAAAVLAAPPDDRRLRQLFDDGPSAVGGPVRPRSRRVSGPTGASLLAAAAVAVVVAAPAGPVLGLVVALAGPRVLARFEPRAVRAQRERLQRDVPLLLELLGACLAGGAPLPAATQVVGAAVAGPAGARLRAVAAALAVGTAPAEAWLSLAGAETSQRAQDPLAAAARALARASEGGAPVASAVSRLAAEVRAERRSAAEQAARRVGVLAVAPLGLCFLPAFLLLGVVPVVVGLAGPLLRSL
jgi:Flp pilus assembly protein TadB